MRYDEAWDAYFVALDEAEPSGGSVVRCSRTQPNDTIDVEVVLNGADGAEVYSMKAALTCNAYASAVSEPVYLYSISDAELTPEPQTCRRRVIQVEGIGESLVESRFVSTMGYALWMPEGVFSYVSDDRGDCFIPENPNAAGVELVIAPATDEALSAGEVSSESLENGVSWIRSDREFAGTIERTYLIDLPELRLIAAATFPAEAAEGYGARLDEMLRTLEPTA